MTLFLIDFDGTIADTFDSFVAGVQNDLRRRGRPPLTNIAHLRTLGARAALKHAGIRWWELPFFVHRVRPAIIADLPNTQPFSGMKQAIAALAQHGRVEVVTTNSTTAVEAYLRKHGIAVSRVRGDVGLFGKKRAILRAAADAGVPAANTIYIGDELRDFDAARGAGVRCALVSWGYNSPEVLRAAKPDWFVTKPRDLRTLTTAKSQRTTRLK